MNTAKIIIIGAGASGIAAASKLVRAGFQNVLVLEAEDRIGGRICTVPFGQNVIDLGAQWCHGEKDNVVFDLASKYNPFDSSLGKYSQFICYRSDGSPIPQDITNRLTAIFHGLYEISKTELIGYKKSLGDYLSDKYKESLNLPENRDIDRNVAAQFYEFYQKFENSIEASDSLFNVSAEGYLQYWECDGDPLLNWKDKGYVSVLHILMGSYPDLKSKGLLNSRIVLGKKVEQVIWDQPNGAINSLVKCSDGSVYEADHVICTASLGVLKDQHTKLFNPKLPLWKLRPIEGLTLGTVDKLFLEFPKPFWSKDWTGASLMWRPEDLPEIRNRKDSWIEDVIGFYVVDYQPNVLCGWITGASARRMEKDSDEVVIAGLMFLLRKFLKQNIPDPIGFRRSNWFTNPNFRGSYSFRSMQTQQMDTSAAELAKPINKPNSETPVLLFAGEATNDHYYSTVHGAIGSGWREANRLIQLYKSQKLGIEDFKRDKTCRNGISERKLDSQPNGECETEAVDVIIVGGGLAGLGAGHRLKDSGLKFKILEAQNYFGGRVLTKEMISALESQKISRNQVQHATVDIGAQWLHGEMNKLYEIGQKNNLLLKEISEEGLGVYIREDGHVIDDFFRKKIDFKIGQILEKCESFIDCDDFPKSLGCFLKEEFEKALAVLETQEERTQASQLYDWYDRFQVIDNSCLELTELSAKFWGFYSLNGESCQAHINFKNGFSRLVECITKEIGLENLHDRSEVSDISWNVFENETGLVEVRTKSGQVFFTNHVIITCSLGVLKTVEQKLFRPQLPSTIQNTIHDMGFETINKIFLQFETPWWGDLEGIQLIYKDNCYEKHKWTRYITGFDILKPGTANTLLAWIGSYGAREMEKLTDHQIVEDCVELLRKFMRCTVPQPIRYYCSRWGTNEFIRGGYSFISTKCDRNGLSGGTILSKPITLKDLPTEENSSVIIDNIKNVSIHENRNNISNKNNYCLKSRPLLLFAGEACHDKYFSTAHGAFLSGIDQAQQILNYYSK